MKPIRTDDFLLDRDHFLEECISVSIDRYTDASKEVGSMFEKGFAREQLERVARMYHSVNDASRAMGITPRSFSRLCRKYDIDTPWQRKRRSREEARRADG
jgi:hypothetical protein